MKDYLKQQIENVSDSNLARCVIREYLQARILESLQENGAFSNWAFLGGTALRFLHQMPRFSEDLDFSLVKANSEDKFEYYMKQAKAVFEKEDYNVTIKVKTDKTVKSAFIKFIALLNELGLSPLSSEIISIKIEIDTNPPKGANLQTTIIRKHCLLNLLHYDKSSLLAGKIHALLSRRYVKGRDIYDLMWYLSDRTWPGPNIKLLNNALRQTGFKGAELTKDNWRSRLADRLEQFDWDRVIRDVKPFIERKADLQLLTKQNMMKLIGVGG